MVVTAGAAAATSAGANAVDRDALRDIAESQDALDALGAGLVRRMSELHALQETFEAAVKKQAKMLRAVSATQSAAATAEKALREQAAANGDPAAMRKGEGPLPSEAEEANGERKVTAAIEGRARDGMAVPISSDQFAEDVDRLNNRLKEMQQLMPRTGGMFVEMFLGSINVRFPRKSERIAFKKEYEVLKLKLAPFFAVFCIICLIFEDYRWVHMILQLSLSSYYVALAVRENILRANGSNIRAWWIIHHYFTMMQGVLMLTWPNSVSYVLFRRRLHLFGLYNAILMIFQTRYQMARLYTLRSLGMAHEMDVASSDSTQIHWSETMRLLLPLIVLGQVLQGCQAFSLFRLYREFPTELQILLLGILFTANFIGNSTTTLQVVLAKRAVSKQRARAASQASTSNRADIAVPKQKAADSVKTLRQEQEKKTS